SHHPSSPPPSPRFFWQLRPRPPPTLSPYTTLFRSGGCSVDPGRVRIRGAAGALNPVADAARALADPVHAAGAGASGVHGISKGTDRKSTRLNSSHSQSSYAVCCLQKKIESRVSATG